MSAGLRYAVEKHQDFPFFVVDMHVGRSDMVATRFCVLKLQRACGKNSPWSFEVVGIGEADVLSAMVGEIEIELAEPAGEPVRGQDQ
ncbi:MAG: hypothetical protein IPG06_18430 [Haliea sp.]|nr:hypothetical protein [Haliea sp.]